MTRRLLVIAATATIALSLTGCTKPNPGVSVTTGLGGAVHAEALCWSEDEAAVDASSCTNDVMSAEIQNGTLPTVTLAAGNTIGISVDPKVADAGWIAAINGQPLLQSPIHQEYFRFLNLIPQPVPEEGYVLSVQALSGDQTRGAWIFRILPAS